MSSTAPIPIETEPPPPGRTKRFGQTRTPQWTTAENNRLVITRWFLLTMPWRQIAERGDFPERTEGALQRQHSEILKAKGLCVPEQRQKWQVKYCQLALFGFKFDVNPITGGPAPDHASECRGCPNILVRNGSEVELVLPGGPELYYGEDGDEEMTDADSEETLDDSDIDNSPGPYRLEPSETHAYSHAPTTPGPAPQQWKFVNYSMPPEATFIQAPKTHRVRRRPQPKPHPQPLCQGTPASLSRALNPAPVPVPVPVPAAPAASPDIARIKHILTTAGRKIGEDRAVIREHKFAVHGNLNRNCQERLALVAQMGEILGASYRLEKCAAMVRGLQRDFSSHPDWTLDELLAAVSGDPLKDILDECVQEFVGGGNGV